MDTLDQVLVVLLNYNGHADSIDCLDSIRQIESPNYSVLLVDNASSDDSVPKIISWGHDKFKIISLDDPDKSPAAIQKSPYLPTSGNDTAEPKLFILVNKTNVGFAAGCNLGMKLALREGFDYVWLLNNDTVVRKDSLAVMLDFLHRNPSCQVATPQIRYHDSPDVIWNCGGKLTWYGARKYYYVNRPYTELPAGSVIDVTFVTGCSLLIRCGLLMKHGVFTERFFFGEEDFDFSLRMKQAGIRMSCCLDAIIYHKVGSSVDKATVQTINKVYIHYLNRFVNLRRYWSLPIWLAWRLWYCFYIYFLLGRKYKITCGKRFCFIVHLLRDSSMLKRVDRDLFFRIINNADYFLSR